MINIGKDDPNKWLDDATAIQLATRAQLAAVQVTRRMHDLKQYAMANLSDPGRSWFRRSGYDVAAWNEGYS